VQTPDDPQNLNRYSYVNNNPQNYIDPSGHFFKKLIKFLKKAFTVGNKLFLWQHHTTAGDHIGLFTRQFGPSGSKPFRQMLTELL
jgi:hypothetical protein